jgi:hypothetical protein
MLSPNEEFGVGHAERKFGLLSHASDLEWKGSPGVGSSDGRPERTAQILVEKIS